MIRIKVNTPTTPAAIHDQYQSGPEVSLTLETPLSKPRPEIFLFEQDVSNNDPANTAKRAGIRRVRRIHEEYPSHSRTASLAGTVPSVGSITGNFQNESPLHPAAAEFLNDAFARGWADPSKVHQDSRKTALLLNEAKELISSHLRIRMDQLNFLADPSLGYNLGISGMINSGTKLFYGATDRSEVFAIANVNDAQVLPVDLNGYINYPSARINDLLAWQSINGETGIIARPPVDFSGKVFADCTADPGLNPLPIDWSTALWDSRSWQGPTGLGVFALADRNTWRNPLPHNDSNISSNSFSVPLAIASAVALDHFLKDFERNQITLQARNAKIRNFLITEIGDVDIAGSVDKTVPHLLSFSILYTDAQLLVNELDSAGFSVDSGSACSSANMEPSHVLAAMGILTHGNIRMTLRAEQTEATVDKFLEELKHLVERVRA